MFSQQNYNREPGRSSRFWTYLAVAGVCWLGALIFIFHLDYESMWLDEYTTWRAVGMGPIGLIQWTATDVHPPVYYLWVWAWTVWVGSDKLFVLRLSSAIPAILAVAVCYRLGVEWFGNRRAGLVAALFLSTSGIYVYYARELRMYSLIALMVCVSWWCLGQLYRGKRGSVLAYGASLGLMAYTFYFAGMIVIAQLVVTVLFHKTRLRQVFLAFGLALIAILPWVPVFIGQLTFARVKSGRADAPIIGKFLPTVPTSLQSIGDFIQHYSAQQPAFVSLLVVLALLLVLSPGVRPRYRQWIVAAALWFFLTVVLFFAVNLVIPVYGLRYVFPIIPGLALLVGAAVDQMPSRQVRIGLFALVGIAGIMTHTGAFLPPKTPHRQLLQTIAAEYQPGDRIWYNMSTGALGSDLQSEVAYHLKFDAPQLSTNFFVWNAPSDYLDTKAVPRVWDVRPYWIPLPPQTVAGLTTGRVVSEEYKIDAYTIRLYEAPPLQQGPVVIGKLFDLLASGSGKISYHAGDLIPLKSWWRTMQVPKLDYSYGLYLWRGGTDTLLIAHQDGALTANDKPTSQWLVSDSYQFSAINFQLPTNLASGNYQLWLGVYDSQNPTKLPIDNNSSKYAVDPANSIVRVANFRVE